MHQLKQSRPSSIFKLRLVWSSSPWFSGSNRALWTFSTVLQPHGATAPTYRPRWGWHQSSWSTRKPHRPAWHSLKDACLDLYQWWWISAHCGHQESLLMRGRKAENAHLQRQKYTSSFLSRWILKCPTCRSFDEAAQIQPVSFWLRINGEGRVLGEDPLALKVLHVHSQLVGLALGHQVHRLQAWMQTRQCEENWIV